MSGRLATAIGRLPHVTPRAALVTAVPVLLLPLVPGLWAWLALGVWLLVIALLVRADLRVTPRAGEITVERVLPEKLSIGVPNPVALRIHNASRYRARLIVRETPPPGFSGERVIEPVDIDAHADAEFTLSLTPPTRGEFRFGDVGVRALGPLGLAGRQLTVPLAETCRVFPDITAVRRYALLARRGALLDLGIKAARYAGVGTEFESLREYQHGDAYREIDWKATARRGGPVIRRFEAERSQTVVIAVDTGRLMTPLVDGMSKLDRAVNAALLLAYLAVEAGDHVGLLVFGRDIEAYLPPRKGHRQFLAILDALSVVEGRVEEPDYTRALAYLAARLSKRSLIVLFTDILGTEPSKRLLGVLGGLAPRHLPLVLTQRNRTIESRARRAVATEADVFASAVAEGVLRDKAEALGVLSARGALALDVEPEQLSVVAVNRYLEVKARGRL